MDEPTPESKEHQRVVGAGLTKLSSLITQDERPESLDALPYDIQYAIAEALGDLGDVEDTW